MFIGVTRSVCRGLESGEDQISTDVRNVVQAPKSDTMARGVAIDLLQIAKRVGPQCEAAEHKNLSGKEDFSLGLDQKLVARELNERSIVRLVKFVAHFLMNRANH